MLRELHSKIEYFAWEPTLTFATPGDVAVGYTTRVGTGFRIGNIVALEFFVVTSSFTHTTASGNAQLTGVPAQYAPTNANTRACGALQWQGITKATATNIACKVSGASSTIVLAGSGSGAATANINAADMPTAGSVILLGSITYRIN